MLRSNVSGQSSQPIKLAYRFAKSLARPDSARVESTNFSTLPKPRRFAVSEPTGTWGRPWRGVGGAAAEAEEAKSRRAAGGVASGAGTTATVRNQTVCSEN